MKDLSNSLMNRFSLFSMIDSLYSNNEKQILCINLNNIISEYNDDFKKYCNHFLNKEKKIISEDKSNKSEESQKDKPDLSKRNRPQRQLFVLNKKLIKKYKLFFK